METHRRSPVGVPWLLAVAVAVVGSIAHLVWGNTLPETAVAASLLTVGSGGLTLLAWLYSHGRETLLRVHATATTGGVGLSVLVTLIVGFHRPWADLYIGTAIFACVSWNLRWIRALKGDGDDDHKSDRSGWDEVIGLPGSKAKVKSVRGPRVEVGLTLDHGMDGRDAQRAASQIASYAGLPPNGVRVTQDPDQARKVKLVLMTEDVLKKTIQWPGPSHPGGSIVDPIHVGLYEDGEVEKLYFPGNWTPNRAAGVRSRNATHLLLMGMSGTGKTVTALIIATEILSRRDVVLWWCDAVKGMQSARPIRSGIDWIVTGQAGARSMLNAVHQVIKYRADELGRRGFREWWPGCGMAYLVFWIEEASSVIPDSSVFVRLTEQARSVGISVVVSQQRASHDNIPTSARANLGASLCFGVRAEEDARFALSDETTAAGANPAQWRADNPGYHYGELPGTTVEQWSTMARSYHEEDGPLEAAVRLHRGTRAELDEGSAKAAGPAYRSRETAEEAEAIQRAAEEEFKNTGGRTTGVPRDVPPRADTKYDDGLDDDEDDPDDPDDDDPDGQYVVPEHPEPDLTKDINPRAPIPPHTGGPSFDFGDSDANDTPVLSRSDKERIFEQMLAQMAAAGKVEVRMQELVDLWFSTTKQPPNRGRPFLHEMLGRKVDQGQVERVEGGQGRYRIVQLVSSGD